jgi:MFS family permease
LSSAGASFADIFPVSDRGVALAVFISTAFVGPAVGPITGGFIAEKGGGRWIDGYLAFLSGVVTVALVLLASETCAPVLLRRRAARLSKITNKVFKYGGERQRHCLTVAAPLPSGASPGKFLLEPIVLVLTLYMSIIYGVVYLNFDACPVVFQEFRGWGQGVGSLAFLGIVVGVLLALVFVVVFINPRFNAVASRRGGSAYPEDRLEPAIIGGVAALIGLVGFAATSSPNVHYIAPIIFGAPFGFGVVLIFLPVMGYLVDAYSVYAASVLAANEYANGDEGMDEIPRYLQARNASSDFLI